MKLDQKRKRLGNYKEEPKIQGSQVIDAQSLLELIGNKTTTEGGYIVINDNNLVLILEQIQELSNLGEHETAESLKRFVNEELVSGHIPATSNFDEAFQDWQDKQQFEEVKAFASEWGD